MYAALAYVSATDPTQLSQISNASRMSTILTYRSQLFEPAHNIIIIIITIFLLATILTNSSHPCGRASVCVHSCMCESEGETERATLNGTRSTN